MQEHTVPDKGREKRRSNRDQPSIEDEQVAATSNMASLKERRYRYFAKKSIFFFIVLNYFLALSLPKKLFPISKFSYIYLM